MDIDDGVDLNGHFTVSFCAKRRRTWSQYSGKSISSIINPKSPWTWFINQFQNWNMVGSRHFQGKLKGTLSHHWVTTERHANTMYPWIQYVRETAWEVAKNTVYPCFYQLLRQFPPSSVSPWTFFCFYAQRWVFTRHLELERMIINLSRMPSPPPPSLTEASKNKALTLFLNARTPLLSFFEHSHHLSLRCIPVSDPFISTKCSIL